MKTQKLVVPRPLLTEFCQSECRFRGGSVHNPLCRFAGVPVPIFAPWHQCPRSDRGPVVIQEQLFDLPAETVRRP